jgi:hypothetical protein
MRGIRGEPADVWLRHAKPARFVWRGRMYTVLLVLDHQGAEPSSGECWTVEATPERGVPPATYELCYDAAVDRWTLSRG